MTWESDLQFLIANFAWWFLDSCFHRNDIGASSCRRRLNDLTKPMMVPRNCLRRDEDEGANGETIQGVCEIIY